LTNISSPSLLVIDAKPSGRQGNTYPLDNISLKVINDFNVLLLGDIT